MMELPKIKAGSTVKYIGCSKEQVAWGNFRLPKNNGKYLQFEPAA